MQDLIEMVFFRNFQIILEVKKFLMLPIDYDDRHDLHHSFN